MIIRILGKIFLPLFAFMLLLTSCKNGTDDADYFLDNKNEVGIELADQELGIKFNPPKEWELTPSSLSKKIESKTNPNEGFVYQPIYIFFNNSTLGILSAGKVIAVDSTLASSVKFNYYKGYLAAKYKNANSSLANFTNKKIGFTQIKYEKGNLISYKLFFKNRKDEIIQFEYSVRKEMLETSIKPIKSSIGTIRVL